MAARRIYPIERPFYTTEESAIKELENSYDILESQQAYTRAEEFAGIQLGLYSTEQIQGLALRSASRELKEKLEQGLAGDPELFGLADKKLAEFEVIREQQARGGGRMLAKAGEKGAFMQPETALFTPEERQALKAKRVYRFTPQQHQERMVRDGVVPPENVAVFMSTRPDDIEANPNIPKEVKDVFAGRLLQEHVGPENLMLSGKEGKTTIGDILWEPVKFSLNVLSTGAEFANGFLASYHQAVRESDIAKEIREQGGTMVAGMPAAFLTPPAAVLGAIPGIGTPLSIFKMATQDAGLASRVALKQATIALDALPDGLKTAKGVWTDAGPVKRLSTSLAHARASYEQEAIELAMQSRAPGESDEVTFARIDSILKRLLDEDAGEIAMEWPRTTEVILSGVADPLNIFGGVLFKGTGKLVGALWQGWKKVPYVGAPPRLVGEATKRITDPLKHLLIKGPYETKANMIAGDKMLKGMGDHGEGIKRAIMAASDVGSAAKRALIDKFYLIDDVLRGLGGKEQEPFWEIVEEWGKSGRSSGRLEIEVEKHFGTSRRVPKIKKMVEKYMTLADDFYEMSAKNGQLNDIREVVDKTGSVVGHAVRQASKIDGYIPYRVWDDIGDLNKQINNLGFVDVDSAILAVEKVKAQRLLPKARDPRQLKYLRAKIAQLDKLIAAKPGNKRGDVSALMSSGNKAVRQALYGLQSARSQTDLLFQSKLHRVRPVSGAAKARVPGSKPPIKDARLQWRQHIETEGAKAAKAAEIKELVGYGGIKEISALFTGNALRHALTDGGAVKVMGLSKKGQGSTIDDIGRAVDGLGDELGIEYTVLDGELAQRILQVTNTAFDPTKAAVAVPKVMAMRLEEILPKIGGVEGPGRYKVLADAFEDFSAGFLRPLSQYFRASRTVNRSLAFQAVNTAGAIGIGFMALGMRAMNPALQGGAARLAFNNALADSIGGGFVPALGALGGGVAGAGAALQADGTPLEILGGALGGAALGGVAGKGLAVAATKVPKRFRAENIDIKVGDSSVKMTDIQEILSKYGLIGQSGLRYGGDPTMLSAQLSNVNIPGHILQLLNRAQKKFAVTTRMQQVAQMGDDYQKSIAFMGYLRKHGKVVDGKITQDSIYRAVDFTSEYAGNYTRLTNFEKGMLRDTFAFYSWNRFILPVLAKQMWRNPQRLAAFDKLRKGVEGYVYDTTGEAIPSAGVPDWLKLSGATMAPDMFQPDIDPGSPLSHIRAMGIMETPLAGLSAFAPGFSGESPVSAQYGPVGLGMAMMMGGINETMLPTGRGGKISGIFPSIDEMVDSFDSPEQLFAAMHAGDDSAFYREAKNMVPFGAAMMDLSHLYIKSNMYDEAAELHLRYRVGRDWMGLDHLAAKAFGQTPLSIANYIPGYRLYPVDPVRVAARRKSRALGLLPDKPLE